MGGDVLVTALHHDEALAEAGEALSRDGERLGIAVDPDEAHALGRLEEGLRVAARGRASRRRRRRRERAEGRDDLTKEDGNVTRRSPCMADRQTRWRASSS